MNQLELNIIVYLKNHCRGKENAEHFKKLAEYFELNERELRDIIAHLITDYQLTIGSGQEGYYWICTDDEFSQAYNELMSRVKALAKRAKGLRIGYLKSKQYEEPKQLELLEV